MNLKNVFQIWTDLGEKVPFAVRNERHRWHPGSYYVVRKIEITEQKREYQKKTGKLYGKAWGDLYLRNTCRKWNVEIPLAGTYEWVLVEGVTSDREKKVEA